MTPRDIAFDRARETLQACRDRPYDRATSLPGSFYTDRDLAELERDALFSTEWLCVGRVEELDRIGDYLALELVGEPVVIVHGEDGRLRALSNVCRHRAMTVVTGRGNTGRLVCPYHGWTYDTTGALLRAPSIPDRADFDPERCRLPELALETWLGFVFVSLGPAPPSLSGRLCALESLVRPYHLEEMRLRHLETAQWETNWKCLMENFMEGYHLSPLHRDTLHKVNPSRLCRHFPPGEQHFGYRVGFDERVPGSVRGHPDLDEDQSRTCVMFAIPPGLAVGGAADYSSFLCLQPRGVDRVWMKTGLLFYGDTWTDAEIDGAVELFDATMAEDEAVLRQVQRGLGSRHHAPGPLAPVDLEGPIWDFYQYLARRLLPALSPREDPS